MQIASHPEICRVIGERARSLRVFAGRSVEDVVTILDVSAGEVEAIEDGCADPLPKKLVRLARLYGVGPEKFFPPAIIPLQ